MSQPIPVPRSALAQQPVEPQGQSSLEPEGQSPQAPQGLEVAGAPPAATRPASFARLCLSHGLSSAAPPSPRPHLHVQMRPGRCGSSGCTRPLRPPARRCDLAAPTRARSPTSPPALRRQSARPRPSSMATRRQSSVTGSSATQVRNRAPLLGLLVRLLRPLRLRLLLLLLLRLLQLQLAAVAHDRPVAAAPRCAAGGRACDPDRSVRCCCAQAGRAASAGWARCCASLGASSSTETCSSPSSAQSRTRVSPLSLTLAPGPG